MTSVPFCKRYLQCRSINDLQQIYNGTLIYFMETAQTPLPNGILTQVLSGI